MTTPCYFAGQCAQLIQHGMGGRASDGEHGLRGIGQVWIEHGAMGNKVDGHISLHYAEIILHAAACRPCRLPCIWSVLHAGGVQPYPDQDERRVQLWRAHVGAVPVRRNLLVSNTLQVFK